MIAINNLKSGPGLMYAQEPRCPEVHMPICPDAHRCPEAQMPRCPDAQIPRCPNTQTPRCPDAQMPRCPEAQMPRCPDAQMPRRPSNPFRRINPGPPYTLIKNKNRILVKSLDSRHHANSATAPDTLFKFKFYLFQNS